MARDQRTVWRDSERSHQEGGEPWIDALGKALATGVSRRTVLKLFGVCTLAGMFGVVLDGCGAIAGQLLCPLCSDCQTCTVDTAANLTQCVPCPTPCSFDNEVCTAAHSSSLLKALDSFLRNTKNFSPIVVTEKAGNWLTTQQQSRIARVVQQGQDDILVLDWSYEDTNSGMLAELLYIAQSSLPQPLIVAVVRYASSGNDIPSGLADRFEGVYTVDANGNIDGCEQGTSSGNCNPPPSTAGVTGVCTDTCAGQYPEQCMADQSSYCVDVAAATAVLSVVGHVSATGSDFIFTACMGRAGVFCYNHMQQSTTCMPDCVTLSGSGYCMNSPHLCYDPTCNGGMGAGKCITADGMAYCGYVPCNDGCIPNDGQYCCGDGGGQVSLCTQGQPCCTDNSSNGTCDAVLCGSSCFPLGFCCTPDDGDPFQCSPEACCTKGNGTCLTAPGPCPP